MLLLLALAAPASTLAVTPGLGGLSDKDFRAGSVQPTSAQISRVTQLGASVRWNRWGTPQSLIKRSGWLATGLSGTPETAARNWIRTNRTLFRLTDTDVTNLELVSSNPIGQGRAILFRQRYGTLKAAQDGLITVAIIGGKVAYASSSATGSKSAPQSAILSAQQAWLKAAAHVGKPTVGGALGAVRTVGDWSVFSATALRTPTYNDKSSGAVDQRARLVAVPTPNSDRAVVAFETIVLDTSGAEPLAYTVFVDARSGSILMRYNRVDHLDQQDDFQVSTGTNDEPTFGQFSGTTDANGQCGPDHAIVAPTGTTSITVAASAVIPANDIVLYLYNSALVEVANMDSGTSPEAIHYEIAPPLPAPATYYARVCQFAADDPLEPFNYEGAFATNDADTSAAQFNYPPKWKHFRAHPSLANDPSPEDYDLANTDTRVIGCWVLVHNGGNVPGCTTSVGKLQNLASRVPWDHIVQTNAPSFTTIGNNAISGEAWTTPLTPGPLQQRPVSLDRDYSFPWTNAWNQSRCATTNLVPGGNDIDAAVTNLFVAHNRMHDWSYFLGFTEDAYNLQTNNFGNNPGPLAENDPEFGQAQSGALLPVEAGVSRDNANQTTLNDGVPGITNMYLWQPIAGGFYSPCVDGDYDMAVIGHEYGHAISNRMAGGPDSNLSGTQARAMGESWSDLMAMEYLNEFGLVPTNGESRYAVGAYATGNNQRGIRNFNMSTSPLNYSDVGYDFVCNQTILGPDIEGTCPDGRTQVHADGEIWSATNFDLRQAFIAKYNGSYPASNDSRQRACAQGTYPASSCPGNRRWAQIMFDAWLLMPAAVSMLDARDAYLAADMIRFNGANQKLLWNVFAHRGMGMNASSAGASDVDPKPDFQSPLEQFKSVTFKVVAADEGNALITNAKVYVGQFEAAANPIADTIPAGALTNTAKFVNGEYEFFVAAPGYGHVRFPRNIVGTGNVTVEIRMSTNRASLTKGAVATGTGTNFNNLFDDTELTNWTGPSPVVAGAALATVDLQGGVQNIKRVNVSAMLNPENGGRFRALRQFEIWTCNGSAATCAVNTNFTKIYTSPANAFPGVRPRPTVPDLILRTFDVPDTNATHVQLRVVSNQCTATGTGFRGDQDADPLNDSDCVTGSDADLDVKAAELQVFSSTPSLPARDPAVAVTLAAPATAASGSQITYTATYTNVGPNESSSAVLTDVLPSGLTFVSASNSGTYNASTRTVRWSLGTVNVGYTGTRTVKVAVNGAVGDAILNQVTYTAPETVAVSIPVVTAIE
ncbi:MAG TPA: M36 family metallopeptidase [Candidatus Limnocylindrales bacterium]|nr:M36 family metallopeptidase [Candidatus Limnocylindrales bacterium]